MKNKSHTCDTWYVLLYSPCNGVSQWNTQWENIHKLGKYETTHEEGALQLNFQRYTFVRFHHCKLLESRSLSTPFESLPSKY
jgi:hypothetical protein